MADPKLALASKFSAAHRFSNFGAAIVSAKIEGFRGVNAEINFEYPVTALSGFNGCGKSTVGQLLLCGYKKLATAINSKRYYVVNFFPVSVVDPKPFADEASITFRYQTDKPDTLQELTVSRSATEWSGYKRQPERNTEYVGFTVYIPKVERRDMSIYSAKSIQLSTTTEIENASTYVSRILGSPYEEVYFQGVTAKHREGELGIAKRFNSVYSENNMGFGEGRVVYTVRLLETCPAQSFIVLEEPETSLHENAQYEFAKYLIDVANRRGHQIVFSTHSSNMMNALPPEGRKLLVRSVDGVEVYDRVSSSRIKTALSAGESGHAIICVEDDFAQSMLREVLRRYDQTLLSSVSVIPFGDAKAVVSAKEALTKAGFKAIVVRDADKGDNKTQHIYKLPGTLPPEKEVFHDGSVVTALQTNYQVDFAMILTANPDTDHHKYAELCCAKAQTSREVLETDCIRAFLDNKGSGWFAELCDDVKSAVAT
ncbi:ATP-dependent nuclease [Sinorhizobium fredii]|uniref:ATP-dependent nuclease n=1 Tax=Rhizobium fredii TaxID=380 RepID=UPI0004B6B6CF|nr:AAA family ATPase [Sinorhizobium fredii]